MDTVFLSERPSEWVLSLPWANSGVPGPPKQVGDGRDVCSDLGPLDHPKITLMIKQQQQQQQENKPWMSLTILVSDPLIFRSSYTSLVYFISGSTPSKLHLQPSSFKTLLWNWESSVDIYTLPCVKQTASGKRPYSTELSLALCDDLEGWQVGGSSRGRGHVYTHSWSTSL